MRSLSFHNKQCCFRRAREHYSSPKIHAVKTQTRVILLCIEARRWQFVLRILLTQHSSSLTNTKTAAWLSACLEAWDSSKSSSSKTYPCLSTKHASAQEGAGKEKLATVTLRKSFCCFKKHKLSDVNIQVALSRRHVALLSGHFCLLRFFGQCLMG